MTLIRQSVVSIFLLLCMVLGGASAAGFLANLVLQWLALALAAWALIWSAPITLPPEGRSLLRIGIMICAVFAMQLVPLPAAVWTLLPGRGAIVDGYRLLGLTLPWLSVSLSWYDTLASFLWLVPALAAALVILRQGAFSGRGVAWTVVGVMIANVLLGALQVVGGAESTGYIYTQTNRNSAVGLFANANHAANLLVSTIPFLAALLAEALRRGGAARQTSAIVALTSTAFIVVAVGLLLNFSLAGLVLFVPATLASLLLILTNKPDKAVPKWGLPVLGLLTAAAVVAIIVAVLSATGLVLLALAATGARKAIRSRGDR